ncbi:MAG: UDP-2,3-diacylglucosamine diphosphatase, partial [Gammaproteobacteria bacterium]
MSTKFIADLHLRPEKPDMVALFVKFLHEQSLDPELQALYILGDLFEAWIGDDFVPPGMDAAVNAISQLTNSGIDTYFMHGNRDFLIGDAFAAQTGCQLLPEYHVMNLYGTPTLLMHGDLLCTDDTDYLKFRKMVRNPLWQQDFLAKPVSERITIAQAARQESQQKTQQLASDIMDVNQDTVNHTMRKWQVPQLIHGHTHR